MTHPVALGAICALTLAMFGDALFGPGSVVLSNRGGDLIQQFIHWRAFGFGELRQGHLALWNPHLFSGTPFFGGFQSALLYPPNALFLVLPLARAVNWSIALHVFLAGAFTYAWMMKRGLRPTAAFLSAVMFMFCGAHFLHIYAGHLPNLCALVWAPLLFLAIDGLFESPSVGWCLLGIFALAMQVLAGHPQYVFYTGVAAALYCACCLFPAEQRGRFALGAIGIVLGGVALSAVQLFTGFQESRETLLGGGLPYSVAAAYSFPPENLLTLLAPQFFGDMKTVAYWGRCCLWEMLLFVGVTSLALAVTGAICGERRARRFSVAMVAMLLLLALGAHTPLFTLLYHAVPGFDKFRGNSKFIFLASLFLAQLAGFGLDALLQGRRVPRWLCSGAAVTGLLLVGGAAAVRHSSTDATGAGAWHSAMLAARDSGEIYYLSADQYEAPRFVAEAGRVAARSLLLGGLLLTATAVLLWVARQRRPAVWLLLGIAVAELFVFARQSLDRFDVRLAVNPEVQQVLASRPGDYRILNLAGPNMALSLGAFDIWGYDPAILRRYGQLLQLTQHVPPQDTILDLPFANDHPLLGMLRCRFIFAPHDGRLDIYERTNYLPHLLLVQRCRVLPERDELFSALADPGFDPRQQVLLESAPDPAPAATEAAGSVRLVDSSTDRLTIEADLTSPAILLITDTYANGWRARALPGSSQRHYQVMRANCCLRAIPLGAGRHRLRVEYMPGGFLVGRWVSMAALVGFIALVVEWVRRQWLAHSSQQGGTRRS